MRKIFLILGLILSLIMFILPMVSADVPSPPDPIHKTIPVINNIANIDDYPDYTFFATANIGQGPGIGMCPIQTVGEDGLIDTTYYKFCSIAVYATKKSDFEEVKNMNESQIEDYLNSSKVTKVIENIYDSEEVLVTSTQDSITNYFNVSLDLSKTEPSNKVIERSYTLYYYLLIPLMAIIILIVILIRRRKNA